MIRHRRHEPARSIMRSAEMPTTMRMAARMARKGDIERPS
jgi:hypothetical protein